jgi:hypothetical protein
MTKRKKRYAVFAGMIEKAMRSRKLSASDVARAMWGTTKDHRGLYDVARGRDRIGHYLSGKSFPEPVNLTKLADILGLDVIVLWDAQPAPKVRKP